MDAYLEYLDASIELFFYCYAHSELNDIDRIMELMLKRGVSKCEHSQIDDLILSLKNDLPLGLDQRMAELLRCKLGQYFIDLHLHITSSNLFHLKAYESLGDGLYVLLKGQVSYMFSPQEHNKSATKTCCTSTTLLSEPWTVFQSLFKNCATLQETYLLRVGEEELELSRFHESYMMRKELYQKQYLSHDHLNIVKIDAEQPFRVDLRIHSHFSFRKYRFRETIILNTPAVLSQGRARLKSSQVRSHEFDRFGVLLPGLKYEVSSSEAEIMVVRLNETLCCHFEHFSQKERTQQKPRLRQLFKTEQPIMVIRESRKDTERRKRDLGKLSKQNEPFSILSAYLCQQNLDFARRHNTHHRTKEKRQTRVRNPLVLFSLSAQKSKLVVPVFQQIITPVGPQPNRSSTAQNSNQSAILRKLRLPPDRYDHYFAKRKPKTSQTFHSQSGNIHNKNDLNLTFNRRETQDNRGSEQQQFTPYHKT